MSPALDSRPCSQPFMKLFLGFNGESSDDAAAFRGGFVAIGNFDGVHLGHQSMIAMLVQRARAANVPAVVLTFEPHPIKLLRPEHTPPSLSTLERKTELLGECGVDCVIAYATDLDLLELSPRAFFESIVRHELDARGLVEGPNFFFGHNRAGSVDTLRDLCQSAGLSLDVVPTISVGDRMVSSSAIRSLISDGKISEAVELLGHAYQVRGTVVPGVGRGQTLGFPTANLCDIETLRPPDGVYAAATIVDGQRFPAAINVGTNPTFGDTTPKLEVHLIGFSGDLYGKPLHVDFLARLRDTQSFPNADALKQQLQLDIKTVQQIAQTNG